MTALDDTLVMRDDTLVGVPLPPARIPRAGAARRRPLSRRRADVLLLVALVIAASSVPPLVEGAPVVPVIRVLTSNVVVVP